MREQLLLLQTWRENKSQKTQQNKTQYKITKHNIKLQNTKLQRWGHYTYNCSRGRTIPITVPEGELYL